MRILLRSAPLLLACLSLSFGCGGSTLDDRGAGGTGADPSGGEAGASPSGSGGSGQFGGSGSGGAGVAECVFELPGSLGELSGVRFFDHPWPSDFRRDRDGLVELTGFPNPGESGLLAAYVAEVDHARRGFSPVASGMVRFTAPVDASTLPASPQATRRSDSSVALLDVDEASPGVGARVALQVEVGEAGDGYWPDGALAFMPALGVPLRPGTRYALVVTDDVRATTGPIQSCASLREILDLQPATSAAAERLRDEWAGPLRLIDDAGIDRGRIVHLTVFTTDDPVRETQALRDWVLDADELPEVREVSAAEQVAEIMDVYEGTYGPSPDFQIGSPPFLAEGGALAVDPPTPQRELELRFVLTLPTGPACDAALSSSSVVLYAHGTGGDYRTVVRSGMAELLAEHCLASFSIDQIFHGTRPGGPCSAGAPSCNPLSEELAVFNAFNPASMRSSNQQAAVDLIQQANLVRLGNLIVPAAVSRTGREIAINAQRPLVLAHSQGATSAPLALAVDDQLLGGVLSGAAAMVSVSLLERSQPEGLVDLLADELSGGGVATRLTVLHPAISLLQMTLDAGDPINYVPFIFSRSSRGYPAKSILMLEGVGSDGRSDTYVSSHAIELNAVAMQLPPAEPLVWPIEELDYAPAQPVTIPAGGLVGNLAEGEASGALVQWEPPADEDPHFVLFDVPAAQNQAAEFLRALAADPVGRIPPR